MAEKSKIQWTDATWNPFHGCKKISPGCKYCYMFRDKERYGLDPTEVVKSKSKFIDPLRWAKNPEKHGAFDGMKIFTCSWSDWFIEEADDWREEAWKIIKDTPQFTYQILTKRPNRIKKCLPKDWGDGYDNVWIGVSVEDQAATDKIQYLFHQPIKTRFLSVEPLIGEVDLEDCVYGNEIWNPLMGTLDLSSRFGGNTGKIDWVIIGGESGNENGKYKYRPCSPKWISDIIDHCKKYKVPVFVKQMGTHISKTFGYKDRHGGDIDEWYSDLQIREFPIKTSRMDDLKVEVPKEDFKDLDNLAQCECGNWTHHSYIRSGGDNSSCPNCTMSFQQEVLDRVKKELELRVNNKDTYIGIIKKIHADILCVSVEDLEDTYYFQDFEF